MVYDLNDFMVLNIKGIDHRCCVFNMSKNDAITLLNKSILDNKGVLQWKFLRKFRQIFVKFMSNLCKALPNLCKFLSTFFEIFVKFMYIFVKF